MYTKIKKFNKDDGFSIIETLMALSISLITSFMILMIVTPGLKYVREVKGSERLHANNVRVADTLTHLIKQSEHIESSSSSELSIRLVDGTFKTVAYSEQSIKLDGDNITDPDILIDDLSFEKINESIKVNIASTHLSTNKKSYNSFTVSKRNNI